MSGIASVTGVKMLQLLAEFLVLIEDVIQGFSESGKKVLKLMRSSDTAFVLVSAPHNAAVRSTATLLSELKRQNYELSLFIVNRCLNTKLDAALTERNARFDETTAQSIPGSDLELLARRRYNVEESVKALQAIKRANFSASIMIGLPELDGAIHSLDALYGFADALTKAQELSGDESS